MNRIPLLIIFFLFKGLYAYPQQDNVITTEGDSPKNIYYNSLNLFMEHLEANIEYFKEKQDSTSIIMDLYFKDLCILDSDFTSQYLTKYKSSRVSIISEDELKEIISKGGEKKRLKIVPLRKNKKFFFVNLIFYKCKIDEDDKLYYPYIKGDTVNYKFNCELNTFEHVKDNSD